MRIQTDSNYCNLFWRKKNGELQAINRLIGFIWLDESTPLWASLPLKVMGPLSTGQFQNCLITVWMPSRQTARFAKTTLSVKEHPILLTCSCDIKFLNCFRKMLSDKLRQAGNVCLRAIERNSADIKIAITSSACTLIQPQTIYSVYVAILVLTLSSSFLAFGRPSQRRRHHYSHGERGRKTGRWGNTIQDQNAMQCAHHCRAIIGASLDLIFIDFVIIRLSLFKIYWCHILCWY